VFYERGPPTKRPSYSSAQLPNLCLHISSPASEAALSLPASVEANSFARVWSHLCVYSGLFGPGKREQKELKRESYSGKIIGQRRIISEGGGYLPHSTATFLCAPGVKHRYPFFPSPCGVNNPSIAVIINHHHHHHHHTASCSVVQCMVHFTSSGTQRKNQPDRHIA